MGHERDSDGRDAGAADRVEAGALARAIDDERRLADLLAPGERPRYLLEGFILDVVRRGDGGDDERTRKMTTTDGGVYALVTDRGVRLVVSYGDTATAYDVGFDELRDVSMRTLGGNRRVRLTLDNVSYDVYPIDGDGSCEAAVAFLTDRAGRGSDGEDDRDPLERLERLADLRDRGALTEAEFDEKKRDLLDDI